MNKKVNTVLFVLGATVINIVVMAILFLICMFLIARFVDPESPMLPLWLGMMFLVSIGGSFFLYTLGMRKLTAKYDLEKYLDPIFTRKLKDRRRGL